MKLTSPPSVCTVRLARSSDDIRAAQRLRYDVFVAEMGAAAPGADHHERLECDRFDAHADHLLLIDPHLPEDQQVVGTYRLMTQAHAEMAGGFYSQTEFDLAPLFARQRPMLELGRSCLHPDYRGGSALLKLWQGIGAYVAANGIDLLFGVASFAGTDRRALAAPLAMLHETYLAPPAYRVAVTGDSTLQMAANDGDQIDARAVMRSLPPLIKAYLRLGGVVGDGAYIDRAFNTTDVFVLFDTNKLTARQKTLFHSGAHGC